MILIVTAVFPPEPVVSANLSFDIAIELSKNEQVTVLSPKPTRPYGMTFEKESFRTKAAFEHIILKTYTCPESKLFGRFRESYSLGKATQKYLEDNHQNIKIIYANTWPLFAQKYLVDTAAKYNIPVVLHVQDIYPESISEKIPFIGSMVNKILLPLDTHILKTSTKVVTISHKMKNYLIKSRSLKEDKISIVRNWQDDSIFLNYKKQLQRNDKFTFMYLGSINPTAGVGLLIHAFGKANLKNAKLVIAGGGSDKIKCMQIAEEYPNQIIEFYEVSGVKVPEMQAKSDILMLPLKKGVAKTALPSKLTAYMLSGKPIIASIDLDSEPADIIRDNGCGFVVEPENEKQLIQCMIEVSEIDKVILEKMAQKSFKYAQENLSKTKNLSKITSMIQNIKNGAA